VVTEHASSRLVLVDNAWVDGCWAGPSVLRWESDELRFVGPRREFDAESSGSISGHLRGTVLPGFTDSHVHLGLIDPDALVAGGLARVVDLGGVPSESRRWQQLGLDSGEKPRVQVEFAGAFLTAPGGYPSTRSWARAESIREIATTADGAAAVTEMVASGASLIKIALNAEAGPTWADEVVSAVVDRAHAAGLPVVAHTEGDGQARRAVLAGVDRLAHTPFSERLSDADIVLHAGRCAWVSTLDIHGWGDHTDQFEIAQGNLRRFAAAGGQVLYGTDLGNGPLPTGLNPREVGALFGAGLSLDAVVSALVPPAYPARGFGPLLSWIPTAATDSPHPIDQAAWLSTATVVPVTALEEILQ